VQQPCTGGPCERGDGFNPHRSFRTGATLALPTSAPFVPSVSIPTGPFGPVQQEARRRLQNDVVVSIPTGPFGPVQLECLKGGD